MPHLIDTSSIETGSSATRKLRLEHDRAGDADALALPAAQQVRVLARSRASAGSRPDLARAPRARSRSISARSLAALVDERARDDLADVVLRVERAVGILKDHLDAAVEGLAVRRRRAPSVLAVDAHVSARRLLQSDERAAGRGLAAAGFADEAEHLARPRP